MFNSSSGNRVPAWKRLGLKLKGPASNSEVSSPIEDVSRPNGNRNQEFDSGSRKRPANYSSTPESTSKRPRNESIQQQSTPLLKRQKSVSFADSSTSNKPEPSAEPRKQAKPRHKKRPSKKQAPAEPIDLSPALDYLRRWDTARDSWKFNTNLQTPLILNVFDTTLFPSSDIATFYKYIRDLKGFARIRLSRQAQEVKDQDTKEDGSNFAEGTRDVEAKEEIYRETIRKLLPLDADMSKRKHFNETNFVAECDDAIILPRVLRRMRAEMVLDELADTTENGETPAETPSTQQTEPDTSSSKDQEKHSTEPSQPAKRRRLAKIRSANLEDSSSSEESDSTDDTSSSSSSEDNSDDEDEEMETNPNAADTSSSSSSSSSEAESSSEEEDSDDEEKR